MFIGFIEFFRVVQSWMQVTFITVNTNSPHLLHLHVISTWLFLVGLQLTQGVYSLPRTSPWNSGWYVEDGLGTECVHNRHGNTVGGEWEGRCTIRLQRPQVSNCKLRSGHMRKISVEGIFHVRIGQIYSSALNAIYNILSNVCSNRIEWMVFQYETLSSVALCIESTIYSKL